MKRMYLSVMLIHDFDQATYLKLTDEISLNFHDHFDC